MRERVELEAERQRLFRLEQAAREEAEKARRIEVFLAILADELRMPLNPILGWAKLLKSRKFDEATATRALDTIVRNTQVLSERIEVLLELSYILKDKLTLKVSPINLATVIEASVETKRLEAEAKSIPIQTQLDFSVGQILGNFNTLHQVVEELLSNAVQFTPKGGRIEVILKQVTSHAKIQITATGKGISLDFLPDIFDLFRQTDSSTTRKFGGFGRGLGKVRYLVELHGGTISAENLGEGLGTTFTVLLPLMSVP